jgi:hypothetical protein
MKQSFISHKLLSCQSLPRFFLAFSEWSNCSIVYQTPTILRPNPTSTPPRNNRIPAIKSSPIVPSSTVIHEGLRRPWGGGLEPALSCVGCVCLVAVSGPLGGEGGRTGRGLHGGVGWTRVRELCPPPSVRPDMRAPAESGRASVGPERVSCSVGPAKSACTNGLRLRHAGVSR